MSATSATIRPVRPSDSPSLSKICLLTGAAGSSAESAHALPELLGLIFALPYNKLETTFGFVLVEKDNAFPDTGTEAQADRVVGYVLGTTDSKKFEQVAEREWWPALRKQFPKGEFPARKPGDTHCISIIHSPYTTPEGITSRFPAHIHIDILPSHQGKSYGRKLMASAVSYLREKGLNSMFVGLDPANQSAKGFYARLGFEKIDREGGDWWGLDFDKFRD